MDNKITKTETSSENVILYFDIQGDEWKKYVDQEIANAAKNIEIKGFRKGKAPIEQAKKHIDLPRTFIKASEKCVVDTMKALDQSGQLKKYDIELFYLPACDITDVNEEKLIFKLTYSKIPEFKIENYKNLDVQIEKPQVSDKEIEDEINFLLKKEMMLTPKTEGALEKNEEADFDFNGFIDGKEFSGGKAEHYKLIIGSNQFIPGFEEQMIGMNIGEERDINLTFPKDYHEKSVANKPVTFKVKLHGINKVNQPNLDDEFVKSLKFTNVNNVAELKTYLKESILNFKKREADQKNVIAINAAIVKATEYSNIPPIIVKDEKERIHEEFKNQLARMNIKEEDFLKMTKKSTSDLDEELQKQATNNIIVLGALRTIIKKENITVSDEDIENAYNKIAQNYHTSIEEVKKMLPNNVLKENVLNEKAVDKLIEWNTK